MKFKARLLSFVEAIRSSYWFVPSAMSVAALILSFVMVEVDRAIADKTLEGVSWLYTGTASGARTLLATIASSMIGLAGVVFSIMIVALTLASGQFGSRLLRNFMRDAGNQITLGTFLAAFLYCLLILRKIQDSTDKVGSPFVPQLSMLVAVLTAVAGLGVLIFFIHHAAASIQAPNVISAVSAELLEAIDTLYPERLGAGVHAPKSSAESDGNSLLPPAFATDSLEVCAETEGYVQRIEAEQLLAITKAHDLIVRMEHRPGQFVQRNEAILRVWPRARAADPVLRDLRESFTINSQRSLAQDAEFAIEQLVQVAVRALSPGINDPFTAIQCVDRLGGALSEFADRDLPSPYRKDDAGHLRVITYPITFGNFVDTSYNQIRQYAAESLDVLLGMLEAMERIAGCVRREEDRHCLKEHAEMVYRLAGSAAGPERDRRKLEQRYARLQHTLLATDPTSGGGTEQAHDRRMS